MKYFRILACTIFTLFAFVYLSSSPVSASGQFNTIVDRNYYIDTNLDLKVVEEEIITNNTTNLYIPSNATKKFEILAVSEEGELALAALEEVKSSIKLSLDGQALKYQIVSSSDRLLIETEYPSKLNPKGKMIFRLEYSHPGMIQKNGALVDIFLNGFSKDTVFQDSRSTISYSTTFHIAKSLAEANFVLPSKHVYKLDESDVTYQFDQNDLVGNYVWIQLGRLQNYKFKISQSIKASQSSNTGNFNNYEVVIPRDIEEVEISQRVYYQSFEPEPLYVKEDDQANLVAGYKFATHENKKIEISGYVVQERTPIEMGATKFGLLSDIDRDDYLKYLVEGDYWQVNDADIQKEAAKLKAGSQDVFEISSKTYQFVIDKIDYSNIKKFGINERQGAIETLRGGAAVCMEYADLYLTLMRAQGVPTRAVFGYGYDPKVSLGQQEAHQWVQVFAPEYDRWVSVDVTWGENGGFLIGGDLNHFYTHIAAVSPDEPPNVYVKGYGDIEILPLEFDISIEENVDLSDVIEAQDLSRIYEYSPSKDAQSFQQIVSSKINAATSNIKEGRMLTVDQSFILLALAFALLAVIFVIKKTLIDSGIISSKLERMKESFKELY